MAVSFLVGFVVIFSLPYFGQATRFLPTIVWDHINPMFKCKCNWLTNIPKIDEYDRVDLMCPSPKLAVKLLDGYSRPRSEMNENIFRRKWEGNNLTDLGKALHNGSFCDPTNSSTRKLYSCKDGEEGKSMGATFKESNGYKTGDIFVFFNNGDDGKASTLSSQAPKCSMVLVINITWSNKVEHDMSYGKHLNPKGHTCDCTNIIEPLNCQCHVNPPYPPTSNCKPPTTTSTKPKSKTEPKLTDKGNAVFEGRVGSDEKWGVEMFFIGFIAGIALLGFVVLVCYQCKRKKPEQSKEPGYQNKAFQPLALPRVEVKETNNVVAPLDGQSEPPYVIAGTMDSDSSDGDSYYEPIDKVRSGSTGDTGDSYYETVDEVGSGSTSDTGESRYVNTGDCGNTPDTVDSGVYDNVRTSSPSSRENSPDKKTRNTVIDAQMTSQRGKNKKVAHETQSTNFSSGNRTVKEESSENEVHV